MTLKINPWVATVLIAGVLILVVALFKGCHQNKLEVAAREKTQHIADSALAVLKDYKAASERSAKDFQDTLELERGQRVLIENQKNKTEADLDKALTENKVLIEKHHIADYTDTATIVVPNQYVQECEDCFTKLENTTKISLKYKDDFNKLNSKWEDLNRINQNRFKQLEKEKLGFYNQIKSLTQQQKEATDKLKPHGRLYLSWGVMWGYWPKMAGAGVLYQSKNSMIYGAKWYYGNQGHMIETTLNFPLSIKL